MRRTCLSAAVGALLALGAGTRAGAQEPLQPLPEGAVVVPPGSQVTIIQVLPPLPSVAPPAAPAELSRPSPIQPAPPSAPPEAATPRATAWVHVHGGPNVRLEAVLADEMAWRPMCQAPCDIRVPVDALYRVSAPGMQPSKGIHLAASDGDRVVLESDLTSEAAHVGGEALMITGGGAIIAGGVLLYLDAIAAGICSTPDSGCSGSSALLWTGIGAAAVGTVALISGIKLFQPSSVEQSSGGAPAPVERGAAREDHFLRSPIWRQSTEASIAPRTTSLPIFTTTF